MSDVRIVVTGFGSGLPGVETPDHLERGRVDGAPAVDAAALMGRKGMRYKDHATRVSLVAARAALIGSGLWSEDGGLAVPALGLGVLASSNLGNVDSVAKVAKLIEDESGTRFVSPVATPLLSSNNVCADVAIRFGCRGPNMMVCNGATSGLDALRWAATWLRSGRARQALVIGVEPDNDVSRAYAGGPLVDGAVAVVLERSDAAAERGADVLAELGPVVRGADLADTVARAGGDGADAPVWFVPEAGAPEDVLPGAERVDVTAGWGRTSGAHGVLQVAAGLARLRAGAPAVVSTCGGPGDDAAASVVLRAPKAGA